MQINITVKQLGKKHPLLKSKSIELEDIGESPSLKEFLFAVVRQQVEAYNQKREQKPILPFLTEKSITDQAETGKVDFGEIYNDIKADLQKAQNRMLEAFNDGLFAVFQDEELLEDLNQNLNLNKQHSFTFLRLAFLAGFHC